MGALNPPTNQQNEIPDQAKGNPVYEQTRQDMPLWCCGRDCGRKSRITVFILGTIGILCSSIVCLSPHYFSFVSLRNDTFYDPEKFQPQPFKYAVQANVGLFRYEILEVFDYPWPPLEENKIFDAMHNRELERLARLDADNQQTSLGGGLNFNFFDRFLQEKFPAGFYDDDDGIDDNTAGVGKDVIFPPPSDNATTYQNDTMDTVLTRAPGDIPIDIADIPIDEVPDVVPGSNADERLPTSTPTFAPTNGNPNDDIDVEVGVVQRYPPGSEFDKLFENGRSGAMWAPILASIGLVFATMEFCCCIYKCSWLPTAIFLYIAFMLQLMTMFLFMSEQFCDYTQDCALGSAGYASVIAVICYFICQTLVCMTPRPPPKFNLLKKAPVRRKKRKKRRPNEFEDDEQENLSDSRGFADEPSYNSSRHLDPYDDQDPYSSRYNDDDNDGSGYQDGSGYGDGRDEEGYSDDYGDGYDQEGYNDSYNNGYDDGYDDNYDYADRRGYDDDAQAYDDRKNHGQSQRSLNDDVYSEDYEEPPTSTSSKKKKKKNKK